MEIKRNKPGWNRKGVKLSVETKLKMSLSQSEWHRTHPHPRKGKRHSTATKLKMSQAQQGDSNANWHGGTSGVIRRLRQTCANQKWRKAVLKRDNHTCQFCATTIKLHAHHIKPVSGYLELIYDVANGLTLCKTCHRRLHYS